MVANISSERLKETNANKYLYFYAFIWTVCLFYFSIYSTRKEEKNFPSSAVVLGLHKVFWVRQKLLKCDNISTIWLLLLCN